MKRSILCAILLCASSNASAAVLVNGMPLPTATPVVAYNSRATGQNFLVRFSLSSTSIVNGFEILGVTSISSVGDIAQIKIREDQAGNPSNIDLYNFNDRIDSITAISGSIAVLTNNFSPITLNAGTYWIGMSNVIGVNGTGNNQPWVTYNNDRPVGPNYQRVLSGNNVTATPGIYDLAYNVLGESAPGAVPEPVTWSMMIGGFGLVGGAMRGRRRKTVVTCATL